MASITQILSEDMQFYFLASSALTKEDYQKLLLINHKWHDFLTSQTFIHTILNKQTEPVRKYFPAAPKKLQELFSTFDALEQKVKSYPKSQTFLQKLPGGYFHPRKWNQLLCFIRFEEFIKNRLPARQLPLPKN
ncbi:MAG: hypothetical protein WCP39_06150 [Chlamydiota bacterium]